MIKVLIIGAGNIGAMYDFNDSKVSTYAKACYLDPDIEFDIFDINADLLEKVSQKYPCGTFDDKAKIKFEQYDIIIISSPTASHYDYLKLLFTKNIRLIVCEKPVDTDALRLDELAGLYNSSQTRVIVNYFRRFQKGIARVKDLISSMAAEDSCTNIIIKYQRGFHNNASHGFDLINFLFDKPLEFSDTQIANGVFDEFRNDPTINFSCRWGNCNLQFVGLSNVAFSHFEVEIYFKKQAIILRNGCDELSIYKTTEKTGQFYPKLSLMHTETGLLDNYMIDVMTHAKLLLTSADKHDNFIAGVNISKKILSIVKSDDHE